MDKRQEILDFWFGDGHQPGTEVEFRREWFVKDPAFDERIRQRFGDDLERAIRGEYDGWADTAAGRLALIILLDQFSRNLFRGSPRSWCQDPLALELCLEGIARGHDRELAVIERGFFYLPLEHAEDLHLQELSVEKFTELADMAPDIAGGDGGLLDYAERHHEIIARFGRFPHRNDVLARPSTDEERAFLEQPNSSF